LIDIEYDGFGKMVLQPLIDNDASVRAQTQGRSDSGIIQKAENSPLLPVKSREANRNIKEKLATMRKKGGKRLLKRYLGTRHQEPAQRKSDGVISRVLRMFKGRFSSNLSPTSAGTKIIAVSRRKKMRKR